MVRLTMPLVADSQTKGLDTMKNVAQMIRESFLTDLDIPLAKREVLEDAARHFESLAKDAQKDAALQAIGESAAQSLAEMVAALECDYDRLEELRELDASDDDMSADDMVELEELGKAAADCESREDAEQRIQEDPLSIEVRSDWRNVDEMDATPDEFCILLGTGGPATRIIGELRDNEPYRARLQVQDWGTPWTDYRGDAVSSDDLLTYCRCFYFGE